MSRPAVILLLSFFIAFNVTGQNTKHSIVSGKVIFDITYPDAQFDQKTMSQLPKESIMYFKGDKAKVEVAVPMGKTVMLTDRKTGDATMLMDMMGSKMAIAMSKEEMAKQKEAQGKPKVELTRESKTIAGYECLKAIVTVSSKDGDKTFDVWYNNELKAKNSTASEIEWINGFMMEFRTTQNGLGMHLVARTVEPMEVEDSEFIVPDGYKKMTMEELKSMQGK